MEGNLKATICWGVVLTQLGWDRLQ